MKQRRGFCFLLTAAAVLCFAGHLAVCAGAADAADAPPEQTETPSVQQTPEQAEFAFSVSGVFSGDAAYSVDAVYIDWAESWYLFLPAAADRSSLTVSCQTPDGSPLILNGSIVYTGEETDLLASADDFAMQAGEQPLGALHVMQSNLGCMYLTAAAGEFDHVNSSKSYTAEGSALILSADGTVQYDGAFEKLKGRGNSSWDYAEKRPYNFKLPQKADLFGLGAAKKWALISNSLDHSLLRNQIAYALSRQSGLAYTPDAAFVDLYLDGEYRGVYQLTERVQIHRERVNITNLEDATQLLNEQPLSEYKRQTVGGTLNGEENGSWQYYDIPNDPADITGGYLIQFQLRSRSKRGEFVTDRGVIFEVCEPEYASKAQTEYIRGFVQELEDAIYSETGYNSRGRHYSDYLDVDSFALGCLIQEITENVDSTSTSFYFYKDSDLTGDGKLHYGPVWDFDLAYQNYSLALKAPDGELHFAVLPDQIYARYVPVSGYTPETAAETGITAQSWQLRLWQDADFVCRSAELYAARFADYLDALTADSGIIAQMQDAIAPAAEMNLIRWHAFGGAPYKRIGPSNGDSFAECVGYVRGNLQKRNAFLRGDYLSESIRACTDALTHQTADVLGLYDAPEQKQLTALQTKYTQQLASAETAPAAAEILHQAEQALTEIPRTLLCGDFDADGSVTLEDAQRLLTYYTATVAGNPAEITATQRRNGDADANGTLDVADATHILRRYTAEMSGGEYPLPAKAQETASGS